MNYKELENKLQKYFNKTNGKFEFIQVNLEIDNGHNIYQVVWSNSIGENDTLANIQNKNVQFFDSFYDEYVTKVIMEFAKQSEDAKFEIDKSIKINKSQAKTIKKLMNLFNYSDRRTQINTRIREIDIKQINELINKLGDEFNI